MSSFAEKVKRWYEKHIYSEAMVRNLYDHGAITAEELAYILGETEGA